MSIVVALVVAIYQLWYVPVDQDRSLAENFVFLVLFDIIPVVAVVLIVGGALAWAIKPPRDQ